MPSSAKASSIHSADTEAVDLSTPVSLARAVHARRLEYVRPQNLKVKIGSWNVAACPGTDKDLASWFVSGRGIDKTLSGLSLSESSATVHAMDGESENSLRLVGDDEIGLYVLGLQEVVDLSMTKELNRAVYTDSSPVDKWKAALEAAMPPGYQLVTSDQMTGLLILVYASPEVFPMISNVSTKQVGTGLLGYFGNKGAVTTRLVLGDTTRMVFVNCHLASGASTNYLERRCWDVGQILSKTQFDPIITGGVVEDDGAKIGDEDFAFWFGDLNFRLDGLPGDDIRRLLTLHTKGEYDVSSNKSAVPPEGEGVIVMKGWESDDDTTTASSVHSKEQSFDSESSLPDPDDFPEDPSQDPASLQSTLDSLLPHDQLRRVISQRKVFHDGWREGPITFLPSYKYDVGTVGLFDSSEKQRAPSWCDRILYRTRHDKEDFEKRAKEEEEAKKKDEEMRSRGLDQDDDVLFSYDPEADGEDQPKGTPGIDYDEYDETEDLNSNEVMNKERTVDKINLDIYTSHQRTISSDHKPITSIFTIDYDAVVPELKAKVHAEVARELDRAENEGRPSVTVVVEGSEGHEDGAIDFEALGFMEKKSQTLTIANTSGVAASFVFVDTPSTDDGGSSVPSWINTTFMQPDASSDDMWPLGSTVTLEPGEVVLAIIAVQVSAISQLRALNDAREKLEDVLVLRVEGGRDHFIPVRGQWLPTCFGRSIDELIRVPDGGIRKFLKDKGMNGSILYDSDVHCSAPRELFKLTEAIQTLSERCVADEAMLEELALPRDPGWPFDASTWTVNVEEKESLKAELVKALDTDAPLLQALPVEMHSSHKLELLSSILLLFLASLTDGIIPSYLWAKLSTAVPSILNAPTTAWPDMKMQVLDVLSSAQNHSIAFVFLTATLTRVASELSPAPTSTPRQFLGRRVSLRLGEDDTSKRRRTRERRYAEIFGPLAFRSSSKDKATRDKERIIIEMFMARDGGG